MRRIGDIKTEVLAERFSDYLRAAGVAAMVEPAKDGVFDVWVLDEGDIARGREALARFIADPASQDFAVAGLAIPARPREERRRERTSVGKHHGLRRVLDDILPRGMALTRMLILLSVLATVLGGLGSGSRLTQLLSITEYTVQDNRLVFDASLPEIARGQIWRLVTPIFLHAALTGSFGILHLLFNMLWLRDLGGMLERAQGAAGLLAKVLVIGAISNVFQFASLAPLSGMPAFSTGGPAFGGMSGVVYGLLGYIWLRGKLDLTSGLYVGGQTMMMMLFWFFLCLSGFMGPVANAAHAGGLLAGLAWGWMAARRVNVRR